MTAAPGRVTRQEYDHMTLRERRAYIRSAAIPVRLAAERAQRAAWFARQAQQRRELAAPPVPALVACAWCRVRTEPGPRCGWCGAPHGAAS